MNNVSRSLSIMFIAHSIMYIPIHGYVYSKTVPITVSSFIDGTPLGINGHETKKLLYIRKQVETLVYGSVVKNADDRLGKYVIGDKHYSIEMLVMLEKKGIMHIDGAPMKELLEEVKKDFMRVAKPFVEQARGVKAMTLKFIEEWAHKHHKENSYLLDWSREEDGHELEAFNKNITSFGQLYEFCVDLVSFITDLIQSCPKGWQQYQELKRGNTL